MIKFSQIKMCFFPKRQDVDIFSQEAQRQTRESLWKCLGLPQQSNTISISFREIHTENPSPKMDCASGFRNDNGLPVHIYERVSERMIQTSCFFGRATP